MWLAPKPLSDQSRRQGFTLVELLIVIVVIGILAAITIVAYNGIQSRARLAVLQSDLSGAAEQLGTDNATNGSYPATAAASNGGLGLKASPGTTYQYTYTAATNSYCLTGTNNAVSYFVSSSNNAPQAGACPGDVNGGSGLTCPTGFIVVPGSSTYGTSDFCVMKYEAKNVSGVATSQAAGTPWNAISQTAAVTAASGACSGCHLITEAEWLTIAQNIASVASNWSGGTVGSGYIYSGHNDNAPSTLLAASTDDAQGYYGETNTGGNQRRTLTLSNSQVIWDFAGDAWEWVNDTIGGNQEPGLASDGNYVAREWNNSALLLHGFSPTYVPSYGTPAAAGWSSAQGIGILYSYYNQTVQVGIARGGDMTSGSWAGIWAITMNKVPGDTNYTDGFRAAK